MMSFLSRRTVASSIAAIGLSVASVAAHALPLPYIDGELSFIGLNTVPSITLSGGTFNSITFNPTGPLNAVGTSGTLATLNPFTVTMTSPANLGTPGTLFTTSNGFQFDYTSATPSVTGTFADVTFVGVLKDTAGSPVYADTPFTLYWSSQTAYYSWSASGGDALPLPGTAALLGLGFLGMGVLRRRAAVAA